MLLLTGTLALATIGSAHDGGSIVRPPIGRGAARGLSDNPRPSVPAPASPMLALYQAPKSQVSPDDFKPLFNSKDLTGWTVYGEGRDVWSVRNGLLVCSGAERNWLMTEKEYGDFSLVVEYRIQEKGNSGIAIRAPLEGNPSLSGMEIAILDDGSFAGFPATEYTGAIWDVVGPEKRLAKPAGEWNTLLVTVAHNKIVIRVNGTRVLAADLDTFRNQSDKHPGLLRRKGHIGLQSHTGRVEFRLIAAVEI